MAWMSFQVTLLSCSGRAMDGSPLGWRSPQMGYSRAENSEEIEEESSRVPEALDASPTQGAGPTVKGFDRPS
ncbi:hypothetical protein BHM03_00049804 [Ensete ventricosum]|nr:hypothetical protein BHM03_00049804 [Ensete ventricosum]